MRQRFANHAPRHRARPITIIVLLALLMLTALNLNARKISEVSTPCDMWEGPCWDISSYAIYADDCNGGAYAIFLRCDCSMEVHYLRTMPIGGLHTTAAWPYEWARRDFVTPGADCGIHMVDDAGREIRFRNPINSAESYSTMQYHERVEVNGGTCGGEIN